MTAPAFRGSPVRSTLALAAAVLLVYATIALLEGSPPLEAVSLGLRLAIPALLAVAIGYGIFSLVESELARHLAAFGLSLSLFAGLASLLVSVPSHLSLPLMGPAPLIQVLQALVVGLVLGVFKYLVHLRRESRKAE